MAVKFMRDSSNKIRSIPQGNQVTVLINASSVDTNLWICPASDDFEIVKVSEVHSAGATGATLQLRKCTGTTAPASGTALLNSALALDSTNNTTVSKTVAGGDFAAVEGAAANRFTAGDRLALDFSGTLTGLVGTLVVSLKRIQGPNANY